MDYFTVWKGEILCCLNFYQINTWYISSSQLSLLRLFGGKQFLHANIHCNSQGVLVPSDNRLQQPFSCHSWPLFLKFKTLKYQVYNLRAELPLIILYLVSFSAALKQHCSLCKLVQTWWGREGLPTRLLDACFSHPRPW